MKSEKSYLLCIDQKNLLKKFKRIYEINKVIRQNGYYFYEF